MTMNTMTPGEYLDEFQMNKLHDLMSVIVIMAIVCFFGIVGNSFTIGFYGFVVKRTPTIYLITALACVDLIVCILIIPQIVEMSVNVKFTSAAPCKLLHFFGHWAIETSAVTLGFIAIDRYRHVCFPFKGQVSIVIAKRAVAAIVVFSFVLSLRDFANFDIIEFALDNDVTNGSIVIAHYCTTREDPNYRVSVTLFHSIDAFILVIILIILCFTYGRIVWVIKKGGLTLSADDKQADYSESIEKGDAKGKTVGGYTNEQATHEEESCSDGGNIESLHTVKTKQTSNTKIKGIERSITLMMLVVSVVFCVCFVPYFVVKIGIRSYKSASKLELSAGTQLAIRFTYVNSFANPIVFCFFNPKFRQYIKESVLRHIPGSRQTSTTMSTGLHSQNSAQVSMIS